MKDEKIIFLYKLIEGNVSKSFGLNVARKVGVGEDIISIAEGKSGEMNKKIEHKRVMAFQQVLQFIQNS